MFTKQIQVINEGSVPFDFDVNGDRIYIGVKQSKTFERRLAKAIRGAYIGLNSGVKLRLLPVADTAMEDGKEPYAIVDGRAYATKSAYDSSVRLKAMRNKDKEAGDEKPALINDENGNLVDDEANRVNEDGSLMTEEEIKEVDEFNKSFED